MSLRVLSMEEIPGVERHETVWRDGTKYVSYWRRAKFIVAIGNEQREVIAQALSNEVGEFRDPAVPGWTSVARPVVCKFRTGKRLWPNTLNFYAPNPRHADWRANCPPVMNSNSFHIVGWNDDAIDDRYFSRSNGAQAR